MFTKLKSWANDSKDDTIATVNEKDILTIFNSSFSSYNWKVEFTVIHVKIPHSQPHS